MACALNKAASKKKKKKKKKREKKSNSISFFEAEFSSGVLSLSTGTGTKRLSLDHKQSWVSAYTSVSMCHVKLMVSYSGSRLVAETQC